jgi:hypothetical protein
VIDWDEVWPPPLPPLTLPAQLRLIGTPEEVDALLAAIATVVTVEPGSRGRARRDPPWCPPRVIQYATVIPRSTP